MTEDVIADTTVRAPARRLLYVDNLRVALTVLVVLHHVAVSYSDIPLWYYSEPGRGPSSFALDVFIVLNQAFFMGFFFLVSGFFTPGAYDRKGRRPFLRDRLVRLGVPLLLFVLLVRPLLTIPDAVASGLPYWLYYLISWDPGPTWFLEVLLAFTLVYALVRRDRPAPVERPTAAPRGRAIVAFVVGLTVATYLWRLLVPTTTYVPILGLPTAYYLPQYAGMFALGVVAFRRGWFASLSRRAGWVGFAAAVAAVVVLLPLRLVTAGPLQDLTAAAFESTFAAGMIVALLVLFRECFDRQRALGRFLSRNAFAVYVLHPLVLVALGYAFSWLAAPAVVKFLVVGVLAVPLCWGLAAAVRAVPLARKVF